MAEDYGDRIITYLKSVGASDPRIEPGGKHPRAVWGWRGKTLKYVFSRTPSDWRGLQNTLGDLRRILGDPGIVVPESAPKRTLDEMTASIRKPSNEPATPPSDVAGSPDFFASGKLAIYKSFQVAVVIPVEFEKRFPVLTRVRIDRPNERELVVTKTFTDDGYVIKRQGIQNVAIGTIKRAQAENLRPVAMSTVRVQLVGNDRLVYPIPETTATVIGPVTRPARPVRAPIPPIAAPVSPAEAASVRAPERVIETSHREPESVHDDADWIVAELRKRSVTPNDVRAVLEALRLVENRTVYRLRRTADGAWVFSAPRIE